MSPTEAEQRIVALAPIVERIARRIRRRTSANVMLDDLVQSGMLGLVDAARLFRGDPDNFERYAIKRATGEIIESLRRDDWLPRDRRRDRRRADAARASVEQEYGRRATEQEVSDQLGVPLADYQAIGGDEKIVFHEDIGGDAVNWHADPRPGPLEALLELDRMHALALAIDRLPEPHRTVMIRDGDIPNTKMAARLRVTESRVSQIHAEAVRVLRRKMIDR